MTSLLSTDAAAHVAAWPVEDVHLAEARRRAADLGLHPVDAATGAVLAFLAGLQQARSIVEIGTGTGVSGLWMLGAMPTDGVLTSVDLEAEHQRHAREVFAAAGFAPQRFRLIAGQALDVMPRLTDAGYDLVILDGDPRELGDYLDEAIRLVRPGGVLVAHDVLAGGAVADPSRRDPATVAARDVLTRLREEDGLRPVLLPVGAGLIAAQRLAG